MINIRRHIEVSDARILVSAYSEKQNDKQVAGIKLVTPTGAVHGFADKVKLVPDDADLLDLGLAILSAYNLENTIECIKPTFESWAEDAAYDQQTPGQKALQMIVDVCGDSSTTCPSCPIASFCDNHFNNDIGQKVMPCTDWEIGDADKLKRSY